MTSVTAGALIYVGQSVGIKVDGANISIDAS